MTTNPPINRIDPGKKPPWLKRPISAGSAFQQTRALLKKNVLHTVCQEARCPNMGECFSQHTATFLIMGSRCTRDCRFCAVAHGPESPPDPEEPVRVGKTVEHMGLEYAVVTSVTRDDLPDGGADCFAETIRQIRSRSPNARVEVLIPDFQGRLNALKTLVAAAPDVINHNIETVPGLYARVRPQAEYSRSLELFSNARQLDPTLPLKSGLILGLGETREEVITTLNDLFDHGCRILTMGQYLQPTKAHLPIARFLTPDEFEELRRTAQQIGFDEIASGPFVRSSYNAKSLFPDTCP